MKKRTLVMAGIVALAVMASTRVAQAQESLVVNIPFNFVAGNRTLPAGEYAVTVSGTMHTLLLVDRKDSAASAFLGTNAIVANEIQPESKLIFNRYGDRYFLSQVWSEGSSRGRQLLKSAREKEMAQIAKIETEGQVTLVASLPRTNP
ncbi:MAG: hypothetical protein ACYDCG_11545 [Candidatus Acidiferrales bacterium]